MSFFNLANINSGTVPLSVTSTSTNVALPYSGRFVMVANLGANPAWCCSGIGSGTAATASTGNGVCVPGGAIMTLELGSIRDTYFAAICTSGLTTTLSISVVDGQ